MTQNDKKKSVLVSQIFFTYLFPFHLKADMHSNTGHHYEINLPV